MTVRAQTMTGLIPITHTTEGNVEDETGGREGRGARRLLLLIFYSSNLISRTESNLISRRLLK